MSKSRLPLLNPASPESIELREKDARAVQLKGAGANYDAIAAALGYADGSGARKAVVRGLSRIGMPEAESMRILMIEQLNDIYRRTTEIYSRRHPIVANGKLVKDENGVLLDDDTVRLQAINTLVKIQESTRKLMGLDAPKAVELTGPDGGAIPIEVTAANITQRLRALPAVEAE